VGTGADIEKLPPVVRHVAKKNTQVVNRIAVRIAAMPLRDRERAYRVAEATFQETAEANGLAGLMVERYIRYTREALRKAVQRMESSGWPTESA
jgi:hypothetical protein